MAGTEIAAAVLTLLVPFLIRAGEAAAQKAGDAAWEKVNRLYLTVRARFQHEGDYYRQTLQRFEEQPEVRRDSFREALNEMIASDAAFAKELAGLVRAAQPAGGDTAFTTIVGDRGSVGQLTNIHTVSGNLNLSNQANRPPPGTELPAQYETLRTNLAHHFNSGELRILCFDMGIDDESLSQETKDDLVRALILYCQRRNRIAELVARCQQLRPHVTHWMGEKT